MASAASNFDYGGRGLGMDAESLSKWMLTNARLWLDKGQKFGAWPGGPPNGGRSSPITMR